MIQKYFIILLFIIPLIGCKKYSLIDSGLNTHDWTEETHGNNVDPCYAIVFEEEKVLRIEISILTSDWVKMQNDLASNIKTGNQTPAPTDSEWEPVWVPCSFIFNGKEWYKVGIRYKGNSSLKECVRRNIRKYSFKLDFDQFEDDYPEIKDQRFYGFKQLNLSNGFDDMSLMREKTTSDLFRKFGIPSANASFCEVWIDFGQGIKYFGLYTMVEEVDDTVIETQFQGGGNLYKPEGPAATFSAGTYNTFQFHKKTNLEPVDYSDVRSFYTDLNSDSRTSDLPGWKNGLEKVFDVPHFLKWLAANTIIQNWDTYGKMSHNYYLYNNPVTGKLTWIPWDNNESLRPGKQGGALSLSCSEITTGWPLIRFLINDNAYNMIYKDYLASFIENPFSVTQFQEKIDRQALLIKQYVTKELNGYTFLMSPSSFDPAITELKQHVQIRNTAVNSFLGQ
jgi:spore coat protein H